MTILRTLIAIPCMVLCGWPSLSGAQVGVYLEGGGARVSYGDTVQVTAGTLSAGATALTPNSRFSAVLAGSSTQQSNWTMFGAGQGSVFTPGSHAIRGEAHASASGTTYGSNTGSGRLLGGARLHLTRSNLGGWVGASGGSVIDPIGARAMRLGEAGVWLRLGPAIAQAMVMPVRIAKDLKYTDTEGAINFGSARLEMGAAGGFRSGIYGGDEFPKSWASVNATAWLLRKVGITAAAGNYPADPGQGLPGANYISIGLRIAPKRIVPLIAPILSDDTRVSWRANAPALTIAGGAEGDRTITVTITSAQQVELMADFTDWAPVQMIPGPSSDSWSVSLPVTSGIHQVNIRINGGEWTVPRGLTSVKDEFGGSVGVLVVP